MNAAKVFQKATLKVFRRTMHAIPLLFASVAVLSHGTAQAGYICNCDCVCPGTDNELTYIITSPTIINLNEIVTNTSDMKGGIPHEKWTGG